MILISFAVWFLTKTEFHRFLKGDYTVKDYWQNSKKRRRYPFDVEIIALLLISFAALGIVGFNLEALGIWRAYFFEPLLVFILILNIFPYKKDLRRLIGAFCLSVLAVSLFAIVQKFTGWGVPMEYWGPGRTDRVTFFYGYPNALGLYIAPLLLAILGWTVYGARLKNKIIFALGVTAFISGTLAIFFAGSEGALAGVGAGVAAFAFFYHQKTRWLALGILLIVLAGLHFHAPARDYMVEKATLSDLSGEIRKIQWRETREMLKQDGKWLSGSGLAGYKEDIKPYHQPGFFYNKNNDPDFRRKIMLFNEEYKAQFWQPLEIYLYPHNIFLNFWTELGFLGLLLFLWIFVKYFYYGYKSLAGEQRELALGLITALIAIIIHGLVDVPYFKNDLAVQFWILVALMSLVHRYKKLEIRGS